MADLDLASQTASELAAVLADPRQPTPGAIERNARRMRDGARSALERLVTLMARQTPVAGDLRLTMALLQVTNKEGLIANQFDLITAELLEIDPDAPPETAIGVLLERMARAAADQLARSAAALLNRDVAAAVEVGYADLQINALNRRVFDLVRARDGSARLRGTGLHLMLVARSVERLGDNAVDVAEQAAFVATGSYQEFSDASRPHQARGNFTA